MRQARCFVFIKNPVGDYMAGAPAEAVEAAYATLSLPPSDATVMFRPGTSRTVAEAAAEHAVTCGASRARVEEKLWSKEGPNHG